MDTRTLLFVGIPVVSGMRSLFLSALAFCYISSTCVAAPKSNVSLWTDPEEAKSHPGFSFNGDYVSKSGKKALQVAALDKGKFHVLTYPEGIPGEGWKKEAKIEAALLTTEELKNAIEGFRKIERSSETFGKKAPGGALVLFDGELSEAMEGKVEGDVLWSGAKTTKEVGDFHLHIEFRLPYKPGRELSSQDRGNSGLYIFNNYEVQIIDTYGLDFNSENNAVDLKSNHAQWCASFYKFKTPDVPMSYPPLQWQTYDIDFTAPKFEGGKKVKNARITVRHNGVLVHDDVELPKGTGAGGGRPEKPKGLLYLQDHGNPVAFRNIWLIEK